MQIFEITANKIVKEYDPNRLPPKKNYGTGVGPGVQPQYTATPRMKTAPQPGTAPRLPPPSGSAVATTPTAVQPPYIDAPAQLTGPAAQQRIGTNYDPNVIDVDAKEKTATAPQPQLPAPAEQPAPTPAPAPAEQPAPAAQAAPAAQPDPASVKVQPDQAEKVDIGGSIVRAMRRYNANQANLGWLNPDKDNTRNSVDVDDEGKVTVNGQPYDPKNPYHVKAYRDFKNRAYNQSSLAQPPATTTGPTPAQTTSAKPSAKPAPAAGAQAAPKSDVEQALIKMGYSEQQAAVSASKVPPGTSTSDAVKLILQGKIKESLTWSKRFDPSRTLMEKIKKS